MFGILTEVGGVTTSSQGKPVCKCKITDDAGESHTVNIYQGKGQLPTPVQLNQRCQFNLSTYQGTYQNTPYTGYSGFWDSKTQVAQQTVGGYPKLSPQGQQAPQQAAQRPNAKKDVDWDAIAEGKVRHGVLCAMLQGGLEIDYKAILEYTQFIVTGKIYADQQAGHDNRSVSEQADDIPF